MKNKEYEGKYYKNHKERVMKVIYKYQDIKINYKF